MTFEKYWPTACLPGEYDSMDACDQGRWRGVAQAAYQAGEKAWKDAVIDQLVILHIYQAKHDADPRLAVKDTIDYHVQIALDPQVSSDAAALVQAGRNAMQEEAVKVCEKYNFGQAPAMIANAIKELK